MISNTSQDKFNEMVVLAALAMSFKIDETFLSLDQIWVRGFAPTEAYGRKWIAELLAKKVIDAKMINGSPGDGISKTLLIKNPAAALKSQEKLFFGLTADISRLLESDFHFSLYLKELMLETAACECIEYANYYAAKAQISLVKPSCSNARLKLMLLECEQKQVFMLIWRAIKNVTKNLESTSREVQFTDIIDNAMTCFLRYKGMGVAIESYDRPQSIKPSLLADFLVLLNKEKEAFFQRRAN